MLAHHHDKVAQVDLLPLLRLAALVRQQLHIENHSLADHLCRPAVFDQGLAPGRYLSQQV